MNNDSEGTQDEQPSTIRISIIQQQIAKPQAQDWIYKNIVQQAQSQDIYWRKNYLNRLGIASGEEQKFETKKSLTDPNNPNQVQKSNTDTINDDLKVESSYMDKTGNFLLNFITRTHTDVRNNYIQKLINNRILQTEPSKKHQTFTIFDWDDTLLCTTYLGSYGFIDLPQEVNDQLSSLNESGSRLLQKASSYGDTYIITNAAQGWVEYSSRLYMPKVHEVIFDNKIVVISARYGYEDLFPGDCSKWKVEAFKNIKKQFDSNIITNILCLGDSHIEIDAAHVLAKEFSYPIIKTIKFRENPKPDELVKQQDLVYEKFEQIYTNLKNLTIRLEKKATNQ